MPLIARQFVGGNNGNNVCYDSFGNAYSCRSGWNTWGRWVLLAAVIVAGFLFFFLFSCMTARRRRNMGARPYYGTGWAAHGPVTYNPNVPQQQQPAYNANQGPPNYNQGGYYGQNQGYFGGQQTGTELREPEPTYGAGEAVYQAPTGPPPSKK